MGGSRFLLLRKKRPATTRDSTARSAAAVMTAGRARLSPSERSCRTCDTRGRPDRGPERPAPFPPVDPALAGTVVVDELVAGAVVGVEVDGGPAGGAVAGGAVAGGAVAGATVVGGTVVGSVETGAVAGDVGGAGPLELGHLTNFPCRLRHRSSARACGGCTIAAERPSTAPSTTTRSVRLMTVRASTGTRIFFPSWRADRNGPSSARSIKANLRAFCPLCRRELPSPSIPLQMSRLRA